MRVLIAVPVFNEAGSIPELWPRIAGLGMDVLCVDDASTDATPALLAERRVRTLRHPTNRGYGAALISAFQVAVHEHYDWVVTMDCDRQHDPAWTAGFLDAAASARWDLVSGSRYLHAPPADVVVPGDRRFINATLTAEINRRLGSRLGVTLTDSFCGFKAHRVAPLAGLGLTEPGYAFPMQLWARAAAAGLRITERAVELIYVDPTRTFGGVANPLNDSATRLAHYRAVLDREIAALGLG